MRQIFSKYHGAGNDFVVIDGRGGGFNPPRSWIAAVCDRRRGIGADGILVLSDTPGADFHMRYLNADGSEGMMCGNGGRCIALFAHHLGIGRTTKRFTAADSPHVADIVSTDDTGGGIVSLGMIDVPGADRVEGGWFLDTGTAHWVEFVPDVAAVDVANLGAVRRHDPRFAATGGANANFVQILSDGHIRVRTFERGVEAETLACGTGATAAALITAIETGSTLRNFRVEVPGGTLQVDFESDGNGGFRNIVLTGPAQKVFEGEIDLNFR